MTLPLSGLKKTDALKILEYYIKVYESLYGPARFMSPFTALVKGRKISNFEPAEEKRYFVVNIAHSLPLPL